MMLWSQRNDVRIEAGGHPPEGRLSLYRGHGFNRIGSRAYVAALKKFETALNGGPPDTPSLPLPGSWPNRAVKHARETADPAGKIFRERLIA